MMIDRQLLGDIVLAMVLVLPTAALARSETPFRPAAAASPVMAKAALADQSMTARGVSLLG
jgi:hypothetical protein